ncbi:MAG TPA: hypothetical protein DD400_02550, partial [Rhodospirillaceae bacterium]|nr:hypothetical protein [Rhodospirillaceae bacterium]
MLEENQVFLDDFDRCCPLKDIAYIAAEDKCVCARLFEDEGEDPRLLLRAARQWLKADAARRLLLLSSHKEKLKQLAQRAGFLLLDEGQTEKGVPFVLLGYEEETYQEALRVQNLPASSPLLLVTSETVLHKNYGGIAAYILYLWQALEVKPIIFSSFPLPSSEGAVEGFSSSVLDRNLLRKGALWPLPDEPSLAFLDDAIELLFLYDAIRVIEVQDYIGDAFRFCQAKQAGLLPSGISLITRGHGSHLYLERSARSWQPPACEMLLLQERITIEQADFFAPASTYLADLYRAAGLALPRQTTVCPLPYPLPNKKLEQGALDRLVFFGKPIASKGFADFLEVLRLLKDKSFFKEKIKHILLLGGDLPPTEKKLFDELAKGKTVEAAFLPHGEVQERLAEIGPCSLVLLPYPRDNYPVSVLEVMAAGGQLCAYQSGGIPEMIPQVFHDFLLTSPSPKALAARIEDLFLMDEKARRAKLQAAQKEIWARQKKINDRQGALYASFIAPPSAPPSAMPSVSVALFMNGESKEAARPLLDALAAQTQSPAQLFLIDGAEEGTEEKTEDLPFPCCCLEAKDLLAFCKTPVLVRLRVGGLLPEPTCLASLVACFAQEKEPCVATAGNVAFLEGDRPSSWRDGVLAVPLGSAGLISHKTNTLGPFEAAFSVAQLKKCLVHSEALAEEDPHLFYAKLFYRGGTFAVCPSILWASFSKAELVVRSFDEQERFAQEAPPLGAWEQTRLQALLFQQEKKETSFTPVSASFDLKNLLAGLVRIREKAPKGRVLFEATGQDALWKKRG